MRGDEHCGSPLGLHKGNALAQVEAAGFELGLQRHKLTQSAAIAFEVPDGIDASDPDAPVEVTILIEGRGFGQGANCPGAGDLHALPADAVVARETIRAHEQRVIAANRKGVDRPAREDLLALEGTKDGPARVQRRRGEAQQHPEPKPRGHRRLDRPKKRHGQR